MLSHPRDDIENRVPVWVACSDLYLDNDPGEIGLRSIARACASSPYSGPDLDRIMFNEVWPAFSANLHSVAGNWSGWDESFVKERVLDAYRSRWRLPWRLHPLKRHYCGDWLIVRNLIDEIRAARLEAKDGSI